MNEIADIPGQEQEQIDQDRLEQNRIAEIQRLVNTCYCQWFDHIMLSYHGVTTSDD